MVSDKKRLDNIKKVHITRCRGKEVYCSYCGDYIGKGKIALSIYRLLDHGNKNVWIHAGCIDEFIEYVKTLKEENLNAFVVQGVEPEIQEELEDGI